MHAILSEGVILHRQAFRTVENSRSALTGWPSLSLTRSNLSTIIGFFINWPVVEGHFPGAGLA
jgi:hypothetical protein